MNRRLFLGALAAGGVGAGAGCLGDLDGGAMTASAAPARVSEEAATAVGYGYQGTIKRVETREVGGETVEVTSYTSLYDRSIDLPAERFGDESVPAAAFGVLSTPQVTAGGEEFNPLGESTTEDLAERAQHRYAGISFERAVGGRAVETLGERFPIESHEGTATLNDEYDLEVAADIIRDTHEGDHLVVVAVYPIAELLAEPEQARVDDLIRGLEQYDDLEVDIVETRGDE